MIEMVIGNWNWSYYLQEYLHSTHSSGYDFFKEGTSVFCTQNKISCIVTCA